MKEISFKNVLFIVPVFILLVVQVPHLGLPYFFDEAWSYIPTIIKMADVGPSLLPGVLPIDDCKGHPQFFFFISALWMKIFPSSIIMMRVLPLLFSIGVLATVYVGLLKLVNWEAAFIASLLISVQSMFLAQSLFLLPEMLMTLFFVMSFFFFLNHQFTAYAITSSLMAMTKETAIIFPVIFGVFYLVSLVFKSNREKHRHIYLLALMMPGIIYALFLLLHYLAFGVVFYGDHLQYILLDRPFLHDKIKLVYSFLLLDYGRRFIFIALLIELIVYLFQRPKNGRLILLGILSFLGFMVFSIYNFYTQRYGLVALVLFMIVFSAILGQLRMNTFIKTGLGLSLAAICLYFSLTQKQNSDADMGYVQTISVFEELVQYCEENNLYDEPLSASFNMIFVLRENDLGYVKGQRKFSKVMDWKQFMEGRYFIYEVTMGEIVPGLTYAKEHFKLVKTVTHKHAWGEIYENTNFQEAAITTNP